MVKTIAVSEEFHEYLKAHKRDDETMEEMMKRLMGGPDPEHAAGILSAETARKMREKVDEKRAVDVESKQEMRARFDDDS